MTLNLRCWTNLLILWPLPLATLLLLITLITLTTLLVALLCLILWLLLLVTGTIVATRWNRGKLPFPIFHIFALLFSKQSAIHQIMKTWEMMIHQLILERIVQSFQEMFLFVTIFSNFSWGITS